MQNPNERDLETSGKWCWLPSSRSILTRVLSYPECSVLRLREGTCASWGLSQLWVAWIRRKEQVWENMKLLVYWEYRFQKSKATKAPWESCYLLRAPRWGHSLLFLPWQFYLMETSQMRATVGLRWCLHQMQVLFPGIWLSGNIEMHSKNGRAYNKPSN